MVFDDDTFEKDLQVTMVMGIMCIIRSHDSLGGSVDKQTGNGREGTIVGS